MRPLRPPRCGSPDSICGDAGAHAELADVRVWGMTVDAWRRVEGCQDPLGNGRAVDEVDRNARSSSSTLTAPLFRISTLIRLHIPPKCWSVEFETISHTMCAGPSHHGRSVARA